MMQEQMHNQTKNFHHRLAKVAQPECSSAKRATGTQKQLQKQQARKTVVVIKKKHSICPKKKHSGSVFQSQQLWSKNQITPTSTAGYNCITFQPQYPTLTQQEQHSFLANYDDSNIYQQEQQSEKSKSEISSMLGNTFMISLPQTTPNENSRTKRMSNRRCDNKNSNNRSRNGNSIMEVSAAFHGAKFTKSLCLKRSLPCGAEIENLSMDKSFWNGMFSGAVLGAWTV